jgi:SPIRAL1-like protein
MMGSRRGAGSHAQAAHTPSSTGFAPAQQYAQQQPNAFASAAPSSYAPTPPQQQAQQQARQQAQAQQQQAQAQQHGQPTGQSANAFASGGSQNTGNYMTGRATSRVLAPPGGASSFSLG